MADNFQSAVSSRSGNNNTSSNIAQSPGRELASELGVDFAKLTQENFAKMAGYADDYYNTLLELAKKSNIQELKNKLKNEELSADKRLALQAKLATETQKVELEALRLTNKLFEKENQRYQDKENTALKARRNKQAAINLRSHKAELEKRFKAEYEAAAGDDERQRELREKRKADLEKLNNQLEAYDKDVAKYDNNVSNTLKKVFFVRTKDERENQSQFKADKVTAEKKVIEETLESIRLTYDDLEEDEKETAQRREQELLTELSLLEKEEAKVKQIADAREQGYEKLSKNVNDVYEDAFTLLTENVGRINSRLQGSGLSWGSMTNLISSNLSINPFVKTESVIRKMIDATEAGIAYNVEQRAFLATISDKIASTFNAFDSNLLRLVRLQQADSTIARLGIEASLTKFLNSMYEDTSYLQGLSSQVAGAIIDANAQLGRNASAEFEYTVQKWLGSLSSLGMGDSTITNIAQGLNYLATGDVTSLSNNTSMQTLFAMSANRAGLNYATLLTNGLNASDTNKLLESMITYLKEIAENSDNQVVKNAYGNVLGMSLSDFRSITNLSQSDISTIAGNNLSYDNLVNEVNNQLSFFNLMSRSNISEMLNTSYHNALFGMASDFTNNPALYVMRQMLMFLSGQETDINIPFVNAAGFGLDLNTSVMGLARMALGITQGLSLAGNILQGLTSRGGLDLNSWNAKETTSRGDIGNLLSTVIGGSSTSTYISNSNQTDIKNQSLAQATDDAEETKKITNKNSKDDAKSAENAYEALSLASSKHGNGNEFFWVKDKLFEAIYDSADGGSFRTIDRALINSFTNVFGSQSVTNAGYVKTVMSGTSVVPVTVTNSSIAVTLSQEALDNLKQSSQPQSVKIDSGSAAINIKSDAIKDGVLEALIKVINGEKIDNNLAKVLENIIDDSKGIPIKGSTSLNSTPIQVKVMNGNGAGDRIPVRMN